MTNGQGSPPEYSSSQDTLFSVLGWEYSSDPLLARVSWTQLTYMWEWRSWSMFPVCTLLQSNHESALYMQEPAPGKDDHSCIHLRSKIMKWKRIVFCEILILDSAKNIFNKDKISHAYHLLFSLPMEIHASFQRPNPKKNKELNITSPYVHSRVDCNTFIVGNPMPESTLILGQSRLYPQVRDFEFSLSSTVWKWVTKYWK